MYLFLKIPENGDWTWLPLFMLALLSGLPTSSRFESSNVVVKLHVLLQTLKAPLAPLVYKGCQLLNPLCQGCQANSSHSCRSWYVSRELLKNLAATKGCPKKPIDTRKNRPIHRPGPRWAFLFDPKPLQNLPGAPAKPMEKQRFSPPKNLVFRYQKPGF